MKMKKTTTQILALLILVTLVTLGCSTQPINATGNIIQEIQPSEYVIGFVAPLTGDVAPYGINEKNAVEMAVNDINAQGGINNIPVRIIYEDGKCNGKDATSAAQKLVNVHKVNIILGGLCSSETMAMASITEENKVILFSAFSSSPEITKIGDYLYRIAPSDTEAGRVIADLLVHDNVKRVAFVTENSDYSIAVSKVVRGYLADTDIEIVASETYTSDTRDYRTQLTKVKYSNADAVLFMPQSPIAAGLLVKQATTLGIDIPMYSSNPVYLTEEVYAVAGESLNGLKFIDAPGLNSPKAINYIKRYTEIYGAPVHEWDAAGKYDTAMLTFDAMKICKEDTTCIKTYFDTMTSYKGITGDFSFNEFGDIEGLGYSIHEITDISNSETRLVSIN